MAKKDKEKDKKKKEKRIKRVELGITAPQLEETIASENVVETQADTGKNKAVKIEEKIKAQKKAPKASSPESEGILAKSRVLRLYTRLMEGKSFNREQVAEEFKCSIRSIQRDIDEIKNLLAERGVEEGVYQSLEYDHKVHGYKLVPPMVSMLSNEEAFLVLKILLESRSLIKPELDSIIDKLIDCSIPKINQGIVKQLIGNERDNYVQPKHGKTLCDTVWQLGNAIKKQLFVTVEYQKLNGITVKRKIKPVGVLVSEFYFYLLAFIQDNKQELLPEGEKYPTVYRIDRIKSFKIGRVNFEMPYKAFEEGEFRKRVQFMFCGKLQKIKFVCKTIALEAVLDRLPTAKVIENNGNEATLQAEVFGGPGLEMWLRSQGDNVRILE